MPKYHVEFDIETDNEPSDTLLDNALLAGIRLALPIFAQHGTKVKDNSDSEYDLAWQKRLSDDEETADDAQRNSEGTSAPPASPDDAPDSEPPPST